MVQASQFRASSKFKLGHFHRLCAAALLFFAANQALQAEALTYNFVKLPPFQYQPSQANSDAEGLTIDLIRAAAADSQIDLNYKQLPQQRLRKIAAAGRMQIAMVSSLYIAPVKDMYFCSAKPLSYVKPTLYVNKQLHPHINQPTDLTNEVVYAPNSTSNSLYKLLPATIRQDDSNKGSIVSSAFSRGRIGLMVHFKEHMQSQLDSNPPAFTYQAHELLELDILLCINRNIEDFQHIQQTLELAILKVAHSERGKKIFDKYGLYLEFIAWPATDAALQNTIKH